MGDYNGDGADDIGIGVAPITVADNCMAFANTTEVTTMEHMSLTTQEGAREALDMIDGYIDRVNAERGSIGALQSGL